MKAALLVTFWAIHLNAAVSRTAESAESEAESSSNATEDKLTVSTDENLAECDRELQLCSEHAWAVCDAVVTLSCPLPLSCFRSYHQCKVAEVEAESSSSASEVERSVGSSENPVDCNSQRERCLETIEEKCRYILMPCSLSAYLCDLSHDQCMAESECDSQLWRCLRVASIRCYSFMVPCSLTVHLCRRSYDVCRGPENECDGLLGRCLKTTRITCGFSAITCTLSSQDCYRSHNLCEARNETVRLEMKSSSNALNNNSTVGTSGNPAGCDNQLRLCLQQSWECRSDEMACKITPEICYHNHENCEVAEIGTAWLGPESNSTASEDERNSSTSETPAECENQWRLCLKEAEIKCIYPFVPCSLTAYLCHRAHALCKNAENVTEIAQLEAESSSSPAEVDHCAGFSEHLAECDGQLRRCIDAMMSICRAVQVPCAAATQECRHSHHLCKAENECENRLWRCLETSWITCDFVNDHCETSPKDCYRLHDHCEAVENDCVRSETESSPSASEVERHTNAGCDSELNQCYDVSWTLCAVSSKACLTVRKKCERIYGVCKAGEIGDA